MLTFLLFLTCKLSTFTSTVVKFCTIQTLPNIQSHSTTSPSFPAYPKMPWRTRDENRQGMGSSSSSCDELCRANVFWLACPVPFLFLELRISLSLLCFCSFVCLIPFLVTMGIFPARGGRWFRKERTALVDLFKKRSQASTALSILSRAFLPCMAAALKSAVWQGEMWRRLGNVFCFQLSQPKQSSLLLSHRKAIKPQRGPFYPLSCVRGALQQCPFDYIKVALSMSIISRGFWLL